ncbi:hypothetical protein Lsan_2136 [Legionella santicrucis]|uniref:Prolyl 4-hydroxylase alpha subunit Fe(2+) 2OG dioxygenase domain-containing protein n=1 Tax=Legionella santicrucis TaxID=45074 RepID=A0A0W0YSK7_9GAMM|nr:hypothetical protein [Legionella santicrucis]KTD59880.1 hypothetical protein Lsan_2136 [Legionella santicrucis]
MNLFQSLLEHAYYQTPFTIPRQCIEEAIIRFFEFLTLPDGVKNNIDFQLREGHRRGDVGYKKRIASDDDYRDDKEFFHFHPDIFRRYKNFIDEHPIVSNFLNVAYDIWLEAEVTVKLLLRQLEDQFPGCIETIFPDGKSETLLRFLKYDWQVCGQYLAKPHYDAAAVSLAIAEDKPGLRIGKNQSSLQLIQHQEDKAVFFISSNYKRVFGEQCLFNPAWHDVIQIDKTKIGAPYSRWAIVAFFVPYGVAELPRSLTHRCIKT